MVDTGGEGDAIGYAYNGGGLNNQKLALFGLFKNARDTGRKLVLPYISIVDQIAGSHRPIALDAVFEVDAVTSFARRYEIAIADEDASSREPGGWDYFRAGAQGKRSFSRGGTNGPGDQFTIDFFRCLVPRARNSYLLRKLASDVFEQAGVSVMAQFRVETDWEKYSDRNLAGKVDAREDYLLTPQAIVAKILATLPGTKTIYVACDEHALTVPKASIRQVCREQFGVDLLWKSDFFGTFELSALNFLDLSLIDFEMALRAPVFVGISRSTFSNNATFEKYCLSGSDVSTHYIYNTTEDRLWLRTDNGVVPDPVEASRGHD